MCSASSAASAVSVFASPSRRVGIEDSGPNASSKYCTMSFDSTMTFPSCTRTGTKPRGLMPRKYSVLFSCVVRSTWCSVQFSSFRASTVRTFLLHVLLSKWKRCSPSHWSTSVVVGVTKTIAAGCREKTNCFGALGQPRSAQAVWQPALLVSYIR